MAKGGGKKPMPRGGSKQKQVAPPRKGGGYTK